MKEAITVVKNRFSGVMNVVLFSGPIIEKNKTKQSKVWYTYGQE